MQLKKNSQNCLPENSALSDISIYKGNLTARNLVKNIAFIKKAFPILPIDFYQKKISIINTKDKEFILKGLYSFTDRSKSLFIKGTNIVDEYDSDIDDNRIIEDRIKENEWRTTLDREKLTKVFKHGDVKFINIFHKYKKALEAMGYFIYEKYFTKSLQLYANSRNIELDEDQLANELEKDFYSLVNGVYDA